MSVKKRMESMLEVLLIGLVGLLVLDVLWQVASRHLLKSPSSWTDELATLLIIWVAMLGTSVAFIRNHHLGIDYFVGKWPLRYRLISEVVVQMLVGVFAGFILIMGGLKLVTLTLLTEQVSPALGVKIGHVYLALPVSGTVIFLTALETMATKIKEWKQSHGEEKA